MYIQETTEKKKPDRDNLKAAFVYVFAMDIQFQIFCLCR